MRMNLLFLNKLKRNENKLKKRKKGIEGV